MYYFYFKIRKNIIDFHLVKKKIFFHPNAHLKQEIEENIFKGCYNY